MANNILQSMIEENRILREVVDEYHLRKLPKLEEMSKEELIQYIRKNCNDKTNLTKYTKSVFLAIQHLFYQKYSVGEDIDFDILEGTIHYDINTETYTFTPKPTLKKLLDKAEEKNTSQIKSFLESRLYKIIESMYKLEKN